MHNRDLRWPMSLFLLPFGLFHKNVILPVSSQAGIFKIVLGTGETGTGHFYTIFALPFSVFRSNDVILGRIKIQYSSTRWHDGSTGGQCKFGCQMAYVCAFFTYNMMG